MRVWNELLCAGVDVRADLGLPCGHMPTAAALCHGDCTAARFDSPLDLGGRVYIQRDRSAPDWHAEAAEAAVKLCGACRWSGLRRAWLGAAVLARVHGAV